MDRPLAVIGRALRYYWDEAFNLMVLNLVWLVAQLLVIPGPPATAALFAVTNRVAHGGFSRLAEFWSALSRYFLAGWKWGALNLVITVVFGYAAYFYALSGFPQPYAFALMLINLLILVGWLFTQLFAFPFWLEQTDKRIVLAVRNSLVMQARHLRVTMVAVLVTAAVLALSVAFPVLFGLVTIALLTVLGNTVVVAQVEALQPPGEESGSRAADWPYPEGR